MTYPSRKGETNPKGDSEMGGLPLPPQVQRTSLALPQFQKVKSLWFGGREPRCHQDATTHYLKSNVMAQYLGAGCSTEPWEWHWLPSAWQAERWTKENCSQNVTTNGICLAKFWTCLETSPLSKFSLLEWECLPFSGTLLNFRST